MNELTINGTVYPFRFGFGFVRKIGGQYKVPVPGIPGAAKDAGLYLALSGVYDRDPVELVHVLEVANEGETPRITKKVLEEYIEDESTDIDALFDQVLGFLERANCCRKTMDRIKEMAEEMGETEKQST